MSMTSRERVLAVLNHEIPDRVPIILGVSNATGVKMAPYKGLKDLLGISVGGLGLDFEIVNPYHFSFCID